MRTRKREDIKRFDHITGSRIITIEIRPELLYSEKILKNLMVTKERVSKDTKGGFP